MPFSLGAIRDGIQTVLASVTIGDKKLKVYDTVPDRDLVVPAAVVQPAMIRYQEAFKGGLVEVRMTITLLTPRGSDRVGQNQLDALLSAGTGMTSSIVDALEDAPTLNGSADSSGVEVDHEIEYGVTDINGATYWRAEIALKVLRERL